jgi:hypothetical protein
MCSCMVSKRRTEGEFTFHARDVVSIQIVVLTKMPYYSVKEDATDLTKFPSHEQTL